MNKGDRIRLSAEGRELGFRQPDRLGTIVSKQVSENNTVWVIWDDTSPRSRYELATKFLEVVEQKEPSAQ